MTKTIPIKNLISYFGKINHYLPWILVAALYTPVFFVLYHSRWKSSDYTHAYFILPVFLWLVWRKRTLLRELPRKIKTGSNVLGLAILVLGLSMFIFGRRNNYAFVYTFSLLPVLYGLIIYIYGFNITKSLSFPVFYLVLLAPLPIGIIDSITLPMRYWVSIAVEAILKTFDFPITREGLLLSIGNNELFMGQPCSGFRSMITMFSLGLVYVYISKGSLFKKGILVSSLIPVSLFGNLIRVITISLITYYFGEAAGQGFFHNFSGILIIVLITIGLLGLEYFLGKYMPHTSLPKLNQVSIAQSEYKQYITQQSFNQIPPIKGGEGGCKKTCEKRKILHSNTINKNVYITCALLLFTIIYYFCFSKTNKYVSPDYHSLLKIPLEMNDWNGRDEEQEWLLDDEKYNFSSLITNREYINAKEEILYLTMMNAANFHTPDSCAKGAGFKVRELVDTEFHIFQPQLTGSRSFKARTFYAESDTEGFLTIYWICFDKKRVNWTAEKINELLFSLFNNDRVSLLVRLDIPCKETGIKDALQLARKFISNLSQTVPPETAEYIFGENLKLKISLTIAHD